MLYVSQVHLLTRMFTYVRETAPNGYKLVLARMGGGHPFHPVGTVHVRADFLALAYLREATYCCMRTSGRTVRTGSSPICRRAGGGDIL